MAMASHWHREVAKQTDAAVLLRKLDVDAMDCDIDIVGGDLHMAAFGVLDEILIDHEFRPVGPSSL